VHQVHATATAEGVIVGSVTRTAIETTTDDHRLDGMESNRYCLKERRGRRRLVVTAGYGVEDGCISGASRLLDRSTDGFVRRATDGKGSRSGSKLVRAIPAGRALDVRHRAEITAPFRRHARRARHT
jgi:hypothetical protein